MGPRKRTTNKQKPQIQHLTPNSVKGYFQKDENKKQSNTDDTQSHKMAESTCSDEVVSNHEIKSLIIDMEKKLKSEIQKQVKQLGNSFAERLRKTDERVDQIQSDIEKIEGSVLDLDNKVKSIDNINERIAELERRSEYVEARSRKYNLLIYGIPIKTNENTMAVVREFFLSKLNLDEATVKNLIICNTHRLPQRNNQSSGRTNPPPGIIVKFATMEARNKILSSARNIPRGERITIRTDLPVRLKKKRADLAKIGYTMRQRDKSIITRIQELLSLGDVWLEARPKDPSKGQWKKV